MKHLIRFLSISLFSILFLTACSEQSAQAPKKELLVYCGITMIKPMMQLAKEFEAIHNVKITLTQGGSQDLYDSLKLSQKGDLYLPGSSSYRTKNEQDGLLLDHVFVGYNRVAMMVQKGNPKNLDNNLNHLTDKDLDVVLCNPHSGSIGRASEKVLKKAGLREPAFENATYLTTDSRRLSEALINKDADVVLNWYAAGTWPGTKEHVEVIELDKQYSKPKALEINLTKFSKHPEEAKAFMAYAASKHGLTTFKEFGFLTEPEYQQALTNLTNQVK